MRAGLAILLGLLAWAFFWGLALVVAFDDIDFFSLEDLLDTTAWHHEHIVAALVLIGPVVAVSTILAAVLWKGYREPVIESQR